MAGRNGDGKAGCAKDAMSHEMRLLRGCFERRSAFRLEALMSSGPDPESSTVEDHKRLANGLAGKLIIVHLVVPGLLAAGVVEL